MDKILNRKLAITVLPCASTQQTYGGTRQTPQSQLIQNSALHSKLNWHAVETMTDWLIKRFVSQNSPSHTVSQTVSSSHQAAAIKAYSIHYTVAMLCRQSNFSLEENHTVDTMMLLPTYTHFWVHAHFSGTCSISEFAELLSCINSASAHIFNLTSNSVHFSKCPGSKCCACF